MAEFDWIKKHLSPIASSKGAQGLVDDVAILTNSPDSHVRIITMDTLVEGVHFLSSDPPDTLGQKIARVNISDIICKGAQPDEAMLSVALPEQFPENDFESFCAGLRRDLEDWDIDLLGGDMVTTPGPLVLTLAMTGRCLREGPVTRAGAKAGDSIYVSGVIGAGKLGLEEARAGCNTSSAQHYRVPDIPGCGTAELVSEFANAAIDISDGLISESRHISEASAMSLVVELDTVPWVRKPEHVEDAISLATGGDDFQTLMTVPADKETACEARARQRGLQFTRIGHVRAGEDVQLRWHGVEVQIPEIIGYQH